MRAETPGAAADADPVSGEMARGELFPALEAAAFALPVGGVSEPVQSPAGFHLVQVAEKTPAYEPTLEEVRASIEQKIAERKTRERYEVWLKQLRVRGDRRNPLLGARVRSRRGTPGISSHFAFGVFSGWPSAIPSRRAAITMRAQASASDAGSWWFNAIPRYSQTAGRLARDQPPGRQTRRASCTVQ